MTSDIARLDNEKDHVKTFAAGLEERLQRLESESAGLPLETLNKLQQLRAFELEMLHQTSSLERRLEALEKEHKGPGAAAEGEKLQLEIVRMERQKESVANHVAGLGKRLQALQEPQGTTSAYDVDGENVHLQQRIELLLGARQEPANDLEKLESRVKAAEDLGAPEASSSRRSSKSSVEDNREGLAGLTALMMAGSSRRSSNQSVEDNREGLAGLMRRSIEMQQSLSFHEGFSLGKASSSRPSSLASTEDEHEGLAGLARKSMQLEDCLPPQRLREEREVNGENALRAIGPAWTRGEIERPAGVKAMGSWTKAVYTEEQQRRLNIDETGMPLKETHLKNGTHRLRNLRESRRELTTLREAFAESAASLEKEHTAFQEELAAIRARGSREASRQLRH